jgi:hypothetical protein
VQTGISINGTLIFTAQSRQATGMANDGSSCSGQYSLSVGDTVNFQSACDATSPLYTGGATYNFITILKVS